MLARSVQCYLLCFTRVFQQSMRNVLTNVLVLMAADYPISTATKGSLLAAIPLGYFMTQVPGGALADRIGAKNVMLMALSLSAVCCLVLPTAFEYLGVYGLLGTLTMMGAVQGPMFPTSSVFLARWMPKSKPGEPDEKAWGTSMLDIGISIGTRTSHANRENYVPPYLALFPHTLPRAPYVPRSVDHPNDHVPC